MDFFGFHPLYVVILLALALIIFGPSRLPKMGAQMGRMLREFQSAREGLTQQMREAFEEEPETDFATSTTSVAEEEAEPASEGSAVAVLDPPPAGQTTPEEMGVADTGAADGPWEGFTGTSVEAPEQGAAAEEPETVAALHTPELRTPETAATVPDTPAGGATVEEPETAASLSTPAEGVTAEEPAPAAATPGTPAAEVTAAEVKVEAADTTARERDAESQGH